MIIVTSARAVKAYGIPVSKGIPDNIPWLEGWRLDRTDDVHPQTRAVISNLVTLYTFVIPIDVEPDVEAILNHFRMRLGFSLASMCPALELPFCSPGSPDDQSPVQFVTGNPRKVIGCMNQVMISLSYSMVPMGQDFILSAEHSINSMPMLTLVDGKSGFPDLEFKRRLETEIST
ncbi:MAG: hypothetical protein ACI9R3_001804 [Verrucomicrobiales bacterium]|jgi:hypothetical protein